MGIPDVDETEIRGAARAILRHFGSVIGESQASNIAYVALVGARSAKSTEQKTATKELEP